MRRTRELRVIDLGIELYKLFCTPKQRRKNVLRIAEKGHWFFIQSPC
jgi:hypothetical protein